MWAPQVWDEPWDPAGQDWGPARISRGPRPVSRGCLPLVVAAELHQQPGVWARSLVLRERPHGQRGWTED